jgi:cytochrome c oxidase subunit 3
MRSPEAINSRVLIDSDYDVVTTQFGMWIFIAMEMLFFGGALFLYSSERHFYPEVFAIGSAHLELGIAATNTAVLLTSSLTMALSVHFLEAKRKHYVVGFLILTAVLGAAFLGLKGYEYLLDYRHGTLAIVGYNPDFLAPKEVALFFSLYFLLTALHAVHLTIAVIWCTFLACRIGATKIYQESTMTKWRGPVDVLGLYWHFVDIVWVFLLPLFYLLGEGK